MAVLCLIITLSFFVTIHYLSPLNTEYRQILEHEFKKYDPGKFSWLDDLQERFHCCSITSYESEEGYIPFTVWSNKFNKKTVPKSCCRGFFENKLEWLPEPPNITKYHLIELLRKKLPCSTNPIPRYTHSNGCDKNLKHFMKYDKSNIHVIQWVSFVFIVEATLVIIAAAVTSLPSLAFNKQEISMA